ncbi:tetratricopeptide repeat protein [Frigoriglobus tundricola]|uniref:Uncharacterized protein n=1 Tax=Frigoriglobus tundricola TaxID=2774151 RepID=A0A6M5YPW4_9BACT|nr:tetratricopeptide repeat protein [Frigoriglobus tundricola]QJW95343.1 hypothetical protein FTUN_2891 [Frigoriglobus tundricola]
MGRVAIVGLGVAILTVVFVSDGRASLHHPTDPMAVPVNANGEPEALPFNEFLRRRLVLRNEFNEKWPLEFPDPKDPARKLKSDRGILKDRIDQERKVPNRTQEQSIALAVDLLRFGKADEADGVLVGKQRQGYLGNITLAHIAAAQANPDQKLKSLNWPRALDHLSIATDEVPPKEFPGLTPQQLAWQVKLNRTVLMKFMRLRLEEARGPKHPLEDELPDRIFDVNFVNASGAYEPGVLAPGEAAKLPPDAIATAQQLALWFPGDTRLYWLLAELYAAKGEFAAARKIMNECVDSGTYSNRKALMQHREAVARAADAKGAAPDEALIGPPADQPAEPPPDVPFTMNAVWVYFGAVAALALFALFRAVTKKRKGAADCGPIR